MVWCPLCPLQQPNPPPFSMSTAAIHDAIHALLLACAEGAQRLRFERTVALQELVYEFEDGDSEWEAITFGVCPSGHAPSHPPVGPTPATRRVARRWGQPAVCRRRGGLSRRPPPPGAAGAREHPGAGGLAGVTLPARGGRRRLGQRQRGRQRQSRRGALTQRPHRCPPPDPDPLHGTRPARCSGPTPLVTSGNCPSGSHRFAPVDTPQESRPNAVTMPCVSLGGVRWGAVGRCDGISMVHLQCIPWLILTFLHGFPGETVVNAQGTLYHFWFHRLPASLPDFFLGGVQGG